MAVAAGYSGNWHSDRAFGKFPPIYRSVHKPNPHVFALGLTWGEKWDPPDQRKGETLEREKTSRMDPEEFIETELIVNSK